MTRFSFVGGPSESSGAAPSHRGACCSRRGDGWPQGAESSRHREGGGRWGAVVERSPSRRRSCFGSSIGLPPISDRDSNLVSPARGAHSPVDEVQDVERHRAANIGEEQVAASLERDRIDRQRRFGGGDGCGREDGALVGVGGVDEEIVIRIDVAAVIEVAVGETARLGSVAGVDAEIIIAVDRAIEISVAGIGVADEDRRGVDGRARKESGLFAGEMQHIGGFGVAKCLQTRRRVGEIAVNAGWVRAFGR